MPQGLTDQFMKILMPLASQFHSENDQSRLRLLYIASTRLTLAILLVFGIGIVLLARPFISVWIGPQYAGLGPLVALLTASGIATTTMWPAGSVLQGMAKHRLLAFFALGSGIVNLALSVLLVRPFGIMGVALGSLIPNLIEGLFFVFPYTFRVLGINYQTALREIFLPAIIPAIPMTAVLYFLREALHPASFIVIGLIGGLSALVYAGVYLWTGGNSQERQTAFKMLRDLRQVMLIRLGRATGE
jgi:O-antigen/teichoic acid export membrane protein